eukprot:2897626-Pyramimonas_sp.AAC.1
MPFRGLVRRFAKALCSAPSEAFCRGHLLKTSRSLYQRPFAKALQKPFRSFAGGFRKSSETPPRASTTCQKPSETFRKPPQGRQKP